MSLHLTEEVARDALAFIDLYACGHSCPVNKRGAQHHLVLIVGYANGGQR